MIANAVLESKGITLVIENHPNGMGSSTDMLQEYVSSMGIMFDTKKATEEVGALITFSYVPYYIH